MKYLSIGEFITLGNEVYKCTEYQSDEDSDCSLCDFFGEANCSNMACMAGTHNNYKRTMFIRYDDISEDTNDD